MNVSFKFSLFLTTNYENSSRAADLVHGSFRKALIAFPFH